MMNYDCWRTSMAAAAYGGAPCMESARSCIRHVYAFELAAYMVSAHAVPQRFSWHSGQQQLSNSLMIQQQAGCYDYDVVDEDAPDEYLLGSIE